MGPFRKLIEVSFHPDKFDLVRELITDYCPTRSTAKFHFIE